SISPQNLDFGSVVLLAAPATPTTANAKVFLINGGTQPATITVAPALQTAGTPFAIVTATNTTTCNLNAIVLPQGATCAVVVSFTPTNTTPQTNTLTFSYKVGTTTTPVSIPVTGVGVDQAVVAFGVVSSPFFTAPKSGATTAAKTIALNNTGTGPATVANLYLSGTNSTDFAIDAATTTCAPGTAGLVIAAGASCNVGLTFTPPANTGSFTTTVTAVADLGNNVRTSTSTTVSGLVVAGGIAVTPNPPLDFGTVAIGTSISWSSLNNGFPVTLTNNNTSAITITNIAPHTAGDFTVSNNFCTAAVNPGQSCTFDITFAPTIVGAEPANTIDVTYTGASGSPLQIAVKGTGAAALVATPSTVNETASFGTFATASPSITPGNGSASPVTVTSVSSISDAGYALSFSTCFIGVPISTGGTCSIGLTYTPNVAGTSSTTFTVSYQ